MTFVIGKLEFEGPYIHGSELRAEPGLYAVLCQSEDEYELIDVCETARIDHCLDHDEYANNLLFFQENCNGQICVAVYYTTDLTSEERRRTKDALLVQLDEEALETAC